MDGPNAMQLQKEKAQTQARSLLNTPLRYTWPRWSHSRRWAVLVLFLISLYFILSLMCLHLHTTLTFLQKVMGWNKQAY